MTDITTTRDNQIYAFLRIYIADNGRAPTYREIAEGIGLETISVIDGSLERLQAAGLITRGGFETRRAIGIVEDAAILVRPVGDRYELSGGGETLTFDEYWRACNVGGDRLNDHPVIKQLIMIPAGVK